MVTLYSYQLDTPTIAGMSSSINEQVSNQERQEIQTELQSLRQDTQEFRTDAYLLRTSGSLDAATNERLRAKQLDLERRGEALIKRYARCHTHIFRRKLTGEQTSAWIRMECRATLGYATLCFLALDPSVSSATSLSSQRRCNESIIRQSTTADCWKLSSVAGEVHKKYRSMKS